MNNTSFENENYSLAELSSSIRRDILLMLRFVDSILDKFALLETMIPNASQLDSVYNKSSSSSEPTENEFSPEQHHQYSSSLDSSNLSSEVCSDVTVTPNDIGTVDTEGFFLVESSGCEERDERLNSETSLVNEDSQNSNDNNMKEDLVSWDSFMKRKFYWLINKLFPSQQRFDPEDPFIRKVLIDMGFSDDEHNTEVLHEQNGIIPNVLDSLLSHDSENQHHDQS